MEYKETGHFLLFPQTCLSAKAPAGGKLVPFPLLQSRYGHVRNILSQQDRRKYRLVNSQCLWQVVMKPFCELLVIVVINNFMAFPPLSDNLPTKKTLGSAKYKMVDNGRRGS